MRNTLECSFGCKEDLGFDEKGVPVMVKHVLEKETN